MKPETKEKINQLQAMEQNINTLIGQKQQYQSQSLEIENALSQIEGSENIYRIIGNIMVASPRDKVKQELTDKKDVVDLRLKAIDKQEDKLRKKAGELQKEVMEEIKSGKDGES